MAENQKDTQKEFRAFFENMPLAKMMQKMMDPEGGCCGFNCAEMMSQMMKMCGKDRTEKEGAQEKPVYSTQFLFRRPFSSKYFCQPSGLQT